jgi:hypothetical protein
LLNKTLKLLVLDQSASVSVQAIKDPVSRLIWHVEGSKECLNFVARYETIFMSIHTPEAFSWILEPLLDLLRNKVTNLLQLPVFQ